MKKLMSLIILSFLVQISWSQVELSGIVKDKEGPIAYATVVLKDSNQVITVYDITDEQGAFKLSANPSAYTLEVSMLAYQDWKQEINLEETKTFPDILLESAAQELGEVVVKAKTPLIERKPDRLIFNVDQSLAATGGNALDALQAAPGLMVENDAINMIGKGASAVMIDGRILELSGEELINFLNSIAAEDIQRIELISNPPAKYEAGGSGGLVNIVYKKSAQNYWKASTTFSNNKNKYNYSSLRANFLYSKNKIKLNLSLNGTLGDSREIETWETKYLNGARESNLDYKKQQDNFSGRFAMDYDLSENTFVGFQYFGNFGEPDRTGRTITNIFNSQSRLDSLYETAVFVDREMTSQIFNVHLVSKLDTFGRNVSFDFDYFEFNNRLDRYFTANTFSSNNDFLNVNQAATNLSLQSIDNYSAKVDFEHPLKTINLSYGAKVSFIKTINDLENFNNISGSPVFDPRSSNIFEYDENVQAIYLSGSSAINDKLDMQLGLRLENTITKGFSKTLDQTNENNYLKLFPTFYLAYTKNSNNIFSFNYGRRINRPWFRNLNPFRIYSNTNNYSEGYPFLQPSFSDNFELAYTYNQALTTVGFYSITTNGSGTIFSADNETNVQAIIRRNYYTDYLAGLGEIYVFNKIPWWESQNQFYLTAYKAVFDSEVISATPKNGIRAYVATYNTFALSKSTKFQVNFFYVSPHNSGLSSHGKRYGLDFGLKQNFFDKKLQLSLYAKDIFDTGSLNNILSEVNGVPVNFGMNYSRRYLRFTLNYNLGNNKINVKERKFGNDEEHNRVN